MAVTLPAQNPAEAPDVPPVPTERVPVAFAGDGSGSGPLTWGQAEIWRTMTRKGWLCFGGTLPLGAGAAIQTVAEELRFMMSRFPSMRTRLRFDDGGPPSQVLSASGQTVLEVYDAESEADTRELAAWVSAHYKTAPRDFENEWPVRMAVIRHAKAPAYMVVYTCHLVTDGGGARIIAQDMAARGTGVSPAPPGVEQLQLALQQHSEAGRRQSAASLRYWEKTLQGTKPRPFAASGDWREPRHWTGELSSPALRAAARTIAGRTGADSTSVLLALYAIALRRRGLLDPAVIRPQASNRFRRGLAPMVSNLVQTGICVIETADSTVDQVVARVQRDAMTMYKHAYHDPAEFDALLARDAELRGPGAVPWDDYCWAFLNDRRGDNPTEDDEPATAEQLEPARSTFRWSMKKDNPFEPLFLHIHDTADAIVLTVSADTDRVAPADIEGLARDIEAVAVAAAAEPAGASAAP